MNLGLNQYAILIEQLNIFTHILNHRTFLENYETKNNVQSSSTMEDNMTGNVLNN